MVLHYAFLESTPEGSMGPFPQVPCKDIKGTSSVLRDQVGAHGVGEEIYLNMIVIHLRCLSPSIIVGRETLDFPFDHRGLSRDDHSSVDLSGGHISLPSLPLSTSPFGGGVFLPTNLEESLA